MKTRRENGEDNIRIKYINSSPTIIEIQESSDEEEISDQEDNKSESNSSILSNKSPLSKRSPDIPTVLKINPESSKSRKSPKDSSKVLSETVIYKKSKVNKHAHIENTQKTNNKENKKHSHSKNLSSQSSHHRKKE